MTVVGFPPIVGPDAKVLILGTIPGTRSIEKGEYYSHARNAFWPIIENIIGIPAALPYSERIEKLSKSGIAIWDVLFHADRVGSLDTNITTEVPNDLQTFFDKHRGVELVVFNGVKAAKLYNRLVLPTLTSRDPPLRYETLPSTSPMHTVGIKEKQRHWSLIRESLPIEIPSEARDLNLTNEKSAYSREFIYRATEMEPEIVEGGSDAFDESDFDGIESDEE